MKVFSFTFFILPSDAQCATAPVPRIHRLLPLAAKLSIDTAGD